MNNRIDQMVLKFRDSLADTERLTPAELTAYQERLLDPLLRHAHRNVPGYGKRLAPLFRGDKIDLSHWAEVPILTRQHAQQDQRSFLADRIPPHLGPARAGETSGSTGLPLNFKINDLAEVASLGMTDRAYRWWGYDSARTLASVIPPREIGRAHV